MKPDSKIQSMGSLVSDGNSLATLYGAPCPSLGALYPLGHLRFQVLTPNLKELDLCKMFYVAIVPRLILHLTNAATMEKIKLKICKLSLFTLHAHSNLYDIGQTPLQNQSNDHVGYLLSWMLLSMF